MVNPSFEALNFLGICEFTLERSHIHAINVIKPTLGSLTLLNFRELILERNHLNVISVGEASLGALTFFHLREFLLERNRMSVVTMGRLFGSKLSLCINEHVLERHLMMQSLWKSSQPKGSTLHQRMHVGEKPCQCTVC